ncbi:uncharacterized protein LOC123519537 [Portunus trituberculatus]|uniref:uncharacterized protein LOC123519537 n=1 Tax=Portunus trituberculatus TaxID=210409 RepID=UPI001E1CD6B0|nr:uncharacterized protein LOC123519537 [Portunus trituberculatus]
MQYKSTDDPQQGSLPPGVAETPSPPRHHHSRGHAKLRHRCPFGCSRTHAHREGQHSHPGNNEAPQGTADTHQSTATPLVYLPHHNHYVPYQRTSLPPQPPHHLNHNQQQQQQQQQAVGSGGMVSRGVGEWRVLSLVSKQDVSTNYLTHPLIPADFRWQAIQYMSKRLHMDANIDIRSGKVIERRIWTLEEQVYSSSSSQAEYITKLASRLATILRHIGKCRSPRAPVTHQNQQEVM